MPNHRTRIISMDKKFLITALLCCSSSLASAVDSEREQLLNLYHDVQPEYATTVNQHTNFVNRTNINTEAQNNSLTIELLSPTGFSTNYISDTDAQFDESDIRDF